MDDFVERFLKQLKGYVRNMALPESSIGEGHLVYEAMYYLTEYVKNTNPFVKRLWKRELDDGIKSLVLPKAFIVKNLSLAAYEQTHQFVLMEHPHLAQLREVYAEEQIRIGETIHAFSTWLRESFGSRGYNR